MNANILRPLISQRIPSEQFQLHGLEVVFVDPDKNNKPVGSPNESPYDTPENRAIVADVMANYDTLATAYEAEQKIINKRLAYKAETDPLYMEWQALLAAAHPDAKTRKAEWLAKREEIKAREMK